MGKCRRYFQGTGTGWEFHTLQKPLAVAWVWWIWSKFKCHLKNGNATQCCQLSPLPHSKMSIYAHFQVYLPFFVHHLHFYQSNGHYHHHKAQKKVEIRQEHSSNKICISLKLTIRKLLIMLFSIYTQHMITWTTPPPLKMSMYCTDITKSSVTGHTRPWREEIFQMLHVSCDFEEGQIFFHPAELPYMVFSY